MKSQAPLLADTIVALATAPGPAAVAVVRLSGPLARQIAAQLAPARRARLSHRLSRVALRDPQGVILDDAMLVEMHAPRSYTGEDVVELHLHGATVVVQTVLAACQAHGARPAEPGEYTLRAFLNGRMDLAQAEAVGQLIAASSEAEQRAANKQLGGGFSAAVEALVQDLQSVLVQWNASLDFPEYPTGAGLLDSHQEILRGVAARLEGLAGQSQVGRAQAGRVVLCGPPNAGKSTLLNALAGEERVLVDARPGTTRDPVEVSLKHSLGTWSVCDTAGIRVSEDPLEMRGVALSQQWAARADVAAWIMPAGSAAWPPAGFPASGVVGTKVDLLAEGDRQAWEGRVAAQGLVLLGCVAATVAGRGVAALRTALEGRLRGAVSETGFVVRERHAEALRAAQGALRQVLDGLAGGQTLDMAAFDLGQAMGALGSIIGRDVDQAVLDQIFAEFCIGK